MPNAGTYQQAKSIEDMMLRELAWLWPVGALTAGAIVAVVLAMLLPRHRQGLTGAWVAGSHLTAALLAAAVWWDRGFRAVMEKTVSVDGLGLALCALIGLSGAACVALARPSVRGTDREGEFYAVLCFASLAAVMLSMAADAALLALAIAAVGLATFVLVGYFRADPRANEASVKYYLFGTVCGAVMVYGLSWWFGLAGTTNLQVIGQHLARAPVAVVAASSALVLVGLGYKASFVPFHFWAPDAYDGAPVAVAAYLSVVPKLAAIAALARVLPSALPNDTAEWSTAMAVAAAATMTLGTLAALRQTDLVRLLAYSSIAQSGYLLMGVAALSGSDAALPAVVYYSVAYAAMNLTAFAVVAAVRLERPSGELSALEGLGRRHPWWAAALVASMLSLVGIPPFAGFVGKLELFQASIDAGQAWLAVIAAVNTVMSLYFYLRVLAPALLTPERDRSGEAATASTRPVGALLLAAGVLVLALGVGAQPLLSLAEHASMLLG